jgi:hypothetical protein
VQWLSGWGPIWAEVFCVNVACIGIDGVGTSDAGRSNGCTRGGGGSESCNLLPSDILGNKPDLNDILSGRSLLVDLGRGEFDAGEALLAPWFVCSAAESAKLVSTSEERLERIVVVVLYADCEEGGLENDSELSELSDSDRDENDILSGRDVDCSEAAEDRRLGEGLATAAAA